MHTSGVSSGSGGRLKAAWEGRTVTWTVSPSRTESRYEVATPMCRPWPEREGARRTLKLTVAVSGSLSGEEEMELSEVG